MISNKNTNRTVRTMLIAIALLLILPMSFASEDVDANQIQDGTINNGSEHFLSDSADLSQTGESADAVYVNPSVEKGTGTGTADNPVSSIHEALDLVKEGGTVYLNGKLSDEDNFNITFDGKPNTVTFIGVDNAIIDGNFTRSLAVINSGNYTFKNISFINHYKEGNESYGGVFCNLNGELTFDNCIFENNRVYGINKGHGGAIDNSGKLTITNCTFKNNTADVSNSSGFRKNSADGGAVSNVGKVYIYDTRFIENKALRNGGAIRTQDRSTTYIENCEFTGNVAAYHQSGGAYGGAIYTWDCGLDLYNSTFRNNVVYDSSGYGGRGGAISLNRGTSTMNIKYCEFINNTAGGVGTVDGQSICFDGVAANVNYCTIDTSIYSSSQSVNLNYNWWATNASTIYSLIENLPSSSAIKTFAELKVITDVENMTVGEKVNVFVRLCWNGSDEQTNINLIPLRSVKLASDYGILENANGDLNNGLFETAIILSDADDPIINAFVDNLVFVFSLSKEKETFELSATSAEIYEGDTAKISITSNENENGICLIDTETASYYLKLNGGKGEIAIPNLSMGTHEVTIRYLGNNFDKSENITTKITVMKKTAPETTGKINTEISVKSNIKLIATDYSAGERGYLYTCTLRDEKGNALSDKTVHIALDGKIYNVTTDKNGIGKLRINLVKANTYTCALSFQGDETYNAAKLVISKFTIAKKSTSIKASAKKFKSKTKSKKISVTLKTVKNPYDKKTYLYKGKKITLKVNGKTYTAKTNAKGVAKFTIKITKKGKYTAKIRFAGDKTYKSSTKSIKITIK